MARQITTCCVALLLLLATVAAVPRRVNSIEDLPNDALMLLYWFVQNVNLNSNGISLNFDPSISSHGSHYYGNHEGLLETSPWGYEYYTIGNINDGSFPHYVIDANEENRARILVRVRRDNRWLADRVYITRHTGSYDSSYDPYQTYEVPVNKLQQLGRLSLSDIQSAAHYSYQLQSNTPRYISQAYLFPNQTYNIPQPRQTSDDSILSRLCAVFLLIILVVFLIIAANANQKYR